MQRPLDPAADDGAGGAESGDSGRKRGREEREEGDALVVDLSPPDDVESGAVSAKASPPETKRPRQRRAQTETETKAEETVELPRANEILFALERQAALLERQARVQEEQGRVMQQLLEVLMRRQALPPM